MQSYENRTTADTSSVDSGIVLGREPWTAVLLQALSNMVSAGEWPHLPRFVLGTGSAPSGIPAVPDLLQALAYQHPREDQYSMSRNGHPIDPCVYRMKGGRFNGLRIADLLRGGATMHLYQAHKWVPALGVACAELSAHLGHEVRPTLFITPARERGLGLHTDAYDVLVFQVSGVKRWRVHGRFENGATARMNIPDDEAGAQILSKVLRPSDLLYVPRGCPHVADSLDEVSVHVSFVLRPPTIRDVLLARCHEILSVADFDERVQPCPSNHRDAVAQVMLTAQKRLISALTIDDT